MHEKNSSRTPNINTLKTAVAVGLAGIAIGGAARPPEATYAKTVASAAPPASNDILSFEFPIHLDSAPVKKRPEKFWYGKPAELQTIKQMGNVANAKLTFEMAKEKPWFSFIQMYCVDRLLFRESKFDEHAKNSQSDAYGIPEANPGSKMAIAGKNWENSARTQIRWLFDYYIGHPKKKRNYITPCDAWNHSQRVGWY